MSTYHTPVLLQEILQGFAVTPGKRYIDGTLGGAGHTIAIANRGGLVLSIDADTDALAEAEKRLRDEEISGVQLVHGNFRDIQTIATTHHFLPVDGVLFDLGVSSHQLDSANKGFSYRFTDAPLDLRFDQSSGPTAADIVNGKTTEELYEIIASYGEEQLALPIARALVRARSVNKIQTSTDVLHVVETLVKGDGKYAVCSRVLQALRIEVNGELASLKLGLDGAVQVLASGGRIAVISYHSLEDRITKLFGKKPGIREITKKPILPTHEEVYSNKRSRSAKLRFFEKL